MFAVWHAVKANTLQPAKCTDDAAQQWLSFVSKQQIVQISGLLLRCWMAACACCIQHVSEHVL